MGTSQRPTANSQRRVQTAAEGRERDMDTIKANLTTAHSDNDVLRSELDVALADADAQRAAAEGLDAAVDEAEALRVHSAEEARRRRAAEMALEQAQLEAARSLRRGNTAKAGALVA